MNISLFLSILGLGIAIPFTCVILLNVMIKMKEGDNYQFDVSSLGKIYVIALTGWALFFSSILGG